MSSVRALKGPVYVHDEADAGFMRLINMKLAGVWGALDTARGRVPEDHERDRAREMRIYASVVIRAAYLMLSKKLCSCK